MDKHFLLFPGQGTQSVGMGRELAAGPEVCRALFARASAVLGFDLLKLCLEGPIEELTRSCNTQPAVFVVSAVARAALGHELGRPLPVDGAAGHSLGEWSALYEAKALSFEDMVRVLRARGTFMQEACEAAPGGMLAVIGLPAEKCAEIAAQAGIEVANYNSPLQTVLSGPKDRIPAAADLAKAAGAKRALPMNVAGAFHSSLMQPAADRFAEFLAGVPIQPTAIPVWSNVTGRPHGDPASIRDLMIRQIVSPVRWTDCMAGMAAAGMTHAFECGPGTVLAGLAKRMDPPVPVTNIFDLAGAVEAAKMFAQTN